MLTTQIISKTRDGIELTADEIQYLVAGITDSSIPDYQIAAWAMAVLCRGFTARETALLTEFMLSSGQRLARSGDRPRVDKHSTGGLGDKTSLILAPLLACFDLDVPMLSGRGLGITGGTLDKLESYQGFRCDLSTQQIDQQLEQIGCVITGTTSAIAPADKKLYALRDATATVPSVALITASIMSKKLAENLDCLVLDVKWGSAAFMQTLEQARQLQASLTETGTRCGVHTTAILSDMNQPLGRMVGNACEVNESLEVLRGAGPSDVRDLTIALAAPLLVNTGRVANGAQAESALRSSIENGQALHRYRQMIEAQGGRYTDHLPLAKQHEVLATRSGFVHRMDGQALGHCIVSMGGGRKKQHDPINHRVGMEMLHQIGSSVEEGEPLVRLFFDGSETEVERLKGQVSAALSISDTPVAPPKLILDH